MALVVAVIGTSDEINETGEIYKNYFHKAWIKKKAKIKQLSKQSNRYLLLKMKFLISKPQNKSILLIRPAQFWIYPTVRFWVLIHFSFFLVVCFVLCLFDFCFVFLSNVRPTGLCMVLGARPECEMLKPHDDIDETCTDIKLRKNFAHPKKKNYK